MLSVCCLDDFVYTVLYFEFKYLRYVVVIYFSSFKSFVNNFPSSKTCIKESYKAAKVIKIVLLLLRFHYELI